MTPGGHPAVQVVDLTEVLHAEGDGVHWTLAQPSELNANLVVLEPGHVIDEYTNDAVDVLLVVLAGTGRLTVEDQGRDLGPRIVAHVPRSTRRRTEAAENGLSYLSVHIRRGPLTIGSAPR